MSSRHLEWAMAGGLAGWAAVRLAGADRLAVAERWAVPLLSFTPQAAAAAWTSALLARGKGARATAALAGAALTAAVAPRAVPRRQPGAAGPVLRVLTANLLVGRASAEAVVDLAGQMGADVLFVQELTHDAAARLRLAGVGDLFANQVTDPVAEGSRGSGIYARYPLAAAASLTQLTALLGLPSGRSVRLVCVHAQSPMPPWSPFATTRWRGDLAALPPPDSTPVILAGDFNATLDHAQFRRLLRLGYADAACQVGNGLVPTWAPEAHRGPALFTIDHILTDRRCAVRATSVHRLAGTDHQALYAELRLPA